MRNHSFQLVAQCSPNWQTFVDVASLRGFMLSNWVISNLYGIVCAPSFMLQFLVRVIPVLLFGRPPCELATSWRIQPVRTVQTNPSTFARMLTWNDARRTQRSKSTEHSSFINCWIGETGLIRWLAGRFCVQRSQRWVNLWRLAPTPSRSSFCDNREHLTLERPSHHAHQGKPCRCADNHSKWRNNVYE